jgi:hypothetical protein
MLENGTDASTVRPAGRSRKDEGIQQTDTRLSYKR